MRKTRRKKINTKHNTLRKKQSSKKHTRYDKRITRKIGGDMNDIYKQFWTKIYTILYGNNSNVEIKYSIYRELTDEKNKNLLNNMNFVINKNHSFVGDIREINNQFARLKMLSNPEYYDDEEFMKYIDNTTIKFYRHFNIPHPDLNTKITEIPEKNQFINDISDGFNSVGSFIGNNITTGFETTKNATKTGLGKVNNFGVATTGIGKSVVKNVGVAATGLGESVVKGVKNASTGIGKSVVKNVGVAATGLGKSVVKNVGVAAKGVKNASSQVIDASNRVGVVATGLGNKLVKDINIEVEKRDNNRQQNNNRINALKRIPLLEQDKLKENELKKNRIETSYLKDYLKSKNIEASNLKYNNTEYSKHLIDYNNFKQQKIKKQQEQQEQQMFENASNDKEQRSKDKEQRSRNSKLRKKHNINLQTIHETDE
jgi:hypothetical protein